ncbi:MAG TPA: heme peroxidase family protein [Candidatus Polarisedimenticolia bacterium]|nr:heme peroxidase family protein [Candidatus Polarisedimenticolia bacterium]
MAALALAAVVISMLWPGAHAAPAPAPGPTPPAGTDGTLPGRFGRMFPTLTQFAPPNDTIRAALMELGKPGGLMDAHDDLGAGPVLLITDPTLSAHNPNNPAHTAGTTFLGQFLDHDMTFDTTSRLGQPTRPVTAPNARHAPFDLDSVYGEGPSGSPLLYDPIDRIKFRVESGGLFEDLPRDGNLTAIIADPRNDENVVIAGLQAAFLLFHNRAVDRIRAEDPELSNDEVFSAARRLTTWHYQWIIVHEFLPQIVGPAMVDDILAHGRRYYTPAPDGGFIPVEFQIAYRFGHSMVRPSYRANLAGDHGQPFFGLVFDPSQEGREDPGDLRGGFRSPRRFIGWQTFFDFGDGQVKPNKRIDTMLSTPLFDLPLRSIASGQPPTSLAQRNLLRHLTWQVPSGQAIARLMGEPVLSRADLADLHRVHRTFDASTPLWYYVLREADVMEGGAHLGPVGGRIVGEVFLGLLQTDPDSYLVANPGWIPTLPTRSGRAADFRMTDFLTIARVDPGNRGQ